MTSNTPWPKAAASTLVAAAMLFLVGCQPRSSADYLVDAEKHVAKGDPLTATLLLKTALQTHPEDKATRQRLGELLLMGNDGTGAELELRKSLALGAESNVVLPLIARALLAQEKPEAVIREFGSAELPSGSGYASIKASLAEAYGRLGKQDEALRALKEALEVDPSNTGARLLTVRRKMSEGDYDEAQLLLASVLQTEPRNVPALLLDGDIKRSSKKDIEGALDAYRKAVEADRFSVGAHVALLRLLAAEKQTAEAERRLGAFKAVYPKHPQAFFFTALLALEAGKLDAARDASASLLQVAPTAPLALQLAGAVDLRRRSLLQAENHLGKAVSALPNEPGPRLLLARTLLLQRDYARLLTVLQPLLSEKEPIQQALAMAGEALLQTGEIERAAAYLSRAAKADPADVRSRAALALSTIDKGDIAKGLADLRQLTEVDKSNVADLALIGSLFSQQNWEEALKAVEALEKKSPKSPEAANLRGRIELARGELDKARIAYVDALERDPGFFEAASRLVEIDVVTGKPGDAVKRFEAVVAAKPNQLTGHLALLQARTAAGLSRRQQVQALDGLIKAFPDEVGPRLALIRLQATGGEIGLAMSTVQGALLQMPDEPRLLDALAQLQMDGGQWQQATTTLNRVLSRVPNSLSALMRMAELLARQGDLAGSKSFLHKARVADPSYVPALRTLVDMEIDAGRVAAAKQLIEADRRKRPKDVDLLLLLGDFEQTQGRWAPAVAAFTAALDLRPATTIAVKTHRAKVAGKQLSEASRFVEVWLKLNPADVEFRRYLGDLSLSQGNESDAQRWYAEVLKLKSDYPAVLNNLAWILREKDPNTALQYAEQAVRLQPVAAHIDTLADVQLKLGRASAAMESLKRALQLEPANSTLAVRLVRVQMQSGDKAGAMATLQSIKALPGSGVTDEELLRLRRRLTGS